MHDHLNSADENMARDDEPRMMHDAAAAQQAGTQRQRSRFTSAATTIVAIVSVILIASGVPDQRGAAHLDAGFQRALLVFGVARALNGVISVAQETEIAMQPAGIGVTIQPGQILDPVNDLIERFSWVMLASAVALGTLSLLLEASQWLPLTISTIVAILASAALLLPMATSMRAWRKWVFSATIILVFLRLSVPAVAIGMHYSFTGILEQRYETHAAGLENATARLETLNDESTGSTAPNGTLWDRTKNMVASAKASLDMEARIERYKAAVATTTEDAIQLIIIFLIQTVFLPMLFIAGAIYCLRTGLSAVQRL